MAVTLDVRIDPTRCRGHAICALFFGDGVELDQWGFARVVEDTVDSGRLVRRARRRRGSLSERRIHRDRACGSRRRGDDAIVIG